MLEKCMLEKAPVEKYTIKGVEVNVRRDDLAYLPPLPPNAKMAALYAIVRHAYMKGYREVVMFAKKQTGTPYAIGLPPICKEFGMTCYITYPSNKFETLEWMNNMFAFGNCFIEFLHPNMITINVNQSKKLAEKLGAYFIPFGFDDEISVVTHAYKFELPEKVGTLVLSTMTGMILAGVLKQIYTRRYEVDRVYGISSGRNPANIGNAVQKYLDFPINIMGLKIIEAFERSFKIDQTTDKELYPFPLHPDYEAKAWTWLVMNINKLSRPIWFINSGR